MINRVLSLEVIGKDAAIRGKVAKGGSRTSSSSDSRGRKDAPSSHKLTSTLGELNLRSASRDRSYSHKLFKSLTCCSFIVSIMLLSLAKLSAQI